MRARSNVSRGYFVVALLAIVALFATFSHGPTSVAHDESGDAHATIYRTAGTDSHSLIPLDPRTLADDEYVEPYFSSVTPSSILFSRDGKISAGVDNSGNVVLRQGLTGTELSEFPTAGYGWPVALNADGSKLLVRLDAASSTWWKVFDTATGETVVDIREQTGWASPGAIQVDPVSWTLYHIFEDEATGARQDAPLPAALVAIDLTTGTEIGRLALPEVMNGYWESDSDPDPTSNMPVHHGYVPGMALSPDGSQLAIVHATDDGITLIDTGSLTISRTITMHEETGFLGKFFSFIAPQQAAAKFTEGTERRVFYAADGKHLYVSGYTSTVEGEEQLYEGQGLSVVSVDDGEIERQTLDGVFVEQVVEMSDGSFYVTGFDYRIENATFSVQYIAHLEADAAEVTAERSTFPEYLSFVIVPGA